MSAAWALLLLSALPVRTAETIPEGFSTLHLSGGFAFVRFFDLPAPLPTGELDLGHGLSDGVDLRLLYRTELGVIHRLGPELRTRIFAADVWSFALRLHPSVQFAGARQDGLDYGGDISVDLGALLTFRSNLGALSIEVRPSLELALFENIDGMSFYDGAPRLDSVDFALELEHPLRDDQNLTFRLEARRPLAPDDPFTVLGVSPRVLVGSSFGL